MNRIILLGALLFLSPIVAAPSSDHLQLLDVFGLEYASDPQISPDGQQIVYVRNFMDIMKDRRRSNLWTIGVTGEHRPLTDGQHSDSSPRWSPDGRRLVFVSNRDGSSQIYCRWMDTGQVAKLSHVTATPKHLAWSPDGKSVAFSMFVATKPQSFVDLPDAPEGAKWAAPPRVIREVQYRWDGRGYLKYGFHHLFVLSADGGTARQVTHGDFHHDGLPSWSADSLALIFSARRRPDWEYQPRNTDIYEVSIPTGEIRQLTTRAGPDEEPVVSPDGEWIAYTGFDDRLQGYQVTRLYIMARDGSGSREVTKAFDRSVAQPRWQPDGSGVFCLYHDQGNTRVGRVSRAGKVTELARDVGGTTLGRPYSSGSFSVAAVGGNIAYTRSRPDSPADVAVAAAGASQQLTRLNEDLLSHKKLGKVSEFWYQSSFDKRRIQSWIVTPPDFSPKKKYPLILEIHGGPFANYGDRFSMEVQLYAAAGYVVLYVNPRGSTSYGEEFGNLIHHAYPGHDYDDLMSGVDALIARGYVDANNLFVTGGSGGGVLSSWIIGKTQRFRAAVVAKPVINWYSFTLTADAYPFFAKYWFPALPWEDPLHYLKRSPVSLAGNITTPTMLLTGEVDHRTPISESEQLYQALKLRKVDSMLVRIPGASHNIAARPSQLMAKVAHVLKWFEKYRKATSHTR